MNDAPMTAEQAAEFLGVSVSSIRLWTRTGVLDCLRFGRTVRYTKDHLLNPNREQRAVGKGRTTQEEIRAALRQAAA